MMKNFTKFKNYFLIIITLIIILIIICVMIFLKYHKINDTPKIWKAYMQELYANDEKIDTINDLYLSMEFIDNKIKFCFNQEANNCEEVEYIRTGENYNIPENESKYMFGNLEYKKETNEYILTTNYDQGAFTIYYLN